LYYYLMSGRTPAFPATSYRTATARLLFAHGLRVEAYESGDQFLSRLSACEPGCVLLRLQMPGQSGLQIQRRLRELAPLLPVVFLTGKGDIKASVEAMKATVVVEVVQRQKRFSCRILQFSPQMAAEWFVPEIFDKISNGRVQA
jgi:CheY-like chemotaxis protein